MLRLVESLKQHNIFTFQLTGSTGQPNNAKSASENGIGRCSVACNTYVKRGRGLGLVVEEYVRKSNYAKIALNANSDNSELFANITAIQLCKHNAIRTNLLPKAARINLNRVHGSMVYNTLCRPVESASTFESGRRIQSQLRFQITGERNQ